MDKALENLVGGFRYRRACSNISPRWKLHRQPGKGGKTASIIAGAEGLNSSTVASPRTTRTNKQPPKKPSKSSLSDHAMDVEDALESQSFQSAVHSTAFSMHLVMSNIFSNLTDQDLLACRLVSYKWCQYASFELEARGTILGAMKDNTK